MAVFKSPWSRRTHKVPDYDTDDYILNNSKTKEKITRQDFNNPALTNPMYNWNRSSTRRNHYVDTTLGKAQVEGGIKKWNKKIFGLRKWKNW